MSSEIECQSDFDLEEFSSEWESSVMYYHVLKMKGSYYVWVGTEVGEHKTLVTAQAARPGLSFSVPVSCLLSGNCQDMATASAVRLQAKLNCTVFLSLNIPEVPRLLDHVEKTILQKLS